MVTQANTDDVNSNMQILNGTVNVGPLTTSRIRAVILSKVSQQS